MTKEEIKKQVEDLVAQMTLEEKVAMIHGDAFFKTGKVDRLGIPALIMSDGPMGVRHELHDRVWEAKYDTEDYVTYFPSNVALAATWNTELAYKAGKGLGAEARGRGKDVILAPGINIMRTPLCGRNFEYMSEDPCLISNIAVPVIKGIQENDVAACVKHFALNNQEVRRSDVNVEVDERTLREIYLSGFEASVKEGDSYTIMSAYNKFRGEYCSHSQYLLDTILKEEWAFDGAVISDWAAVHDTEKVVNCGLDLEMSTETNFEDYYMASPLIKAVQEGKVDEVQIDKKVKRVLALMFKVNKFNKDRKKGSYNALAHRETALEVARESVVLLKNEAVLPLDEQRLGKVAVIGENAQRRHAAGGGSAEIKGLYEISPLLGLKMQLGGNVETNYARGYSSEADADKEQLFNEAIELAKASDTVIFIGGLNHDQDSEGLDKKDLKLPYGQDALIAKLLEINTNTVVVLVSGSPVEMYEWIDEAKAVVQSWYAGLEGGTALAEVLLGYVNPSGKLPVTFPKKLEDSPAHAIGEYPGEDTVCYKEGIFVGYRYFDSYDVEPQFCFGHGLAYTTFEYNNLQTKVIQNGERLQVEISFDITNTGDRDGLEIAQIYVAHHDVAVEVAMKELKAFKKVHLNAKETKTIKVILAERDFAYYNVEKNEWNCLEGEKSILVGQSSKTICLKDKINIYL